MYFVFFSTDYSVAFAFTRSSTAKSSNVSNSHSTVTEHFLQDSIKFSDTTLTNYPQDFKNNVLVHVIISFIGVFIFFFAICVLTYIFFKCCQKKSYGIGIEEHKLQTRYNSLQFVAEEPEPTLNVQAENQDNKDSTYLTPVYSSNESNKASISSETIARNENEAISSQNQLFGHQARQETSNTQHIANVYRNDAQEHIYIEISEDNQEK